MRLQRKPAHFELVEASEAVKFLLSGRVTLSEHTPTETVEVSRNIATRSPFLKNIIAPCEQGWDGATPIEVRDVDPRGFALFIEWLSKGDVTKSWTQSFSLHDCLDMIFAHMVGAKFHEPDFQDYMIDQMSSMLDLTQAPDMYVIEILHLEKYTSPVLHKFVTDKMFAQEKRMLHVLRGSRDEAVHDVAEYDTCKYHSPEPGQCYLQQSRTKNELSRRSDKYRAARKPLPPLPPVSRSIRSTSVSSISDSPREISDEEAPTSRTKAKPNSHQGLSNETRALTAGCLSRYEPRQQNLTVTQHLVLECLSRLQLVPDLYAVTKSPTTLISLQSPYAHPSPPLSRLHTPLSSTQLPALVTRKAAPPRGQDWLEQQQTLHALRGTQGFGTRRGWNGGWGGEHTSMGMC
ncbi:hypothetical protein ACN47E_007205 [Coniothyrium glycines]